MKLSLKNIERITITSLVIIFFIVIYFHRDFISNFLIQIVNFLGFTGIFIIAFLLDVIFFQPISPSVFLVLILLSEQYNWVTVFMIISAGSLTGSLLDYTLGRYYGEKIFGIFLSQNKLKDVEKLFKKYSHYGILVGAFTPIPYALVCWFAGMSNVSFKKFIILAPIARTTLFLSYSLLINYGILTFI